MVNHHISRIDNEHMSITSLALTFWPCQIAPMAPLEKTGGWCYKIQRESHRAMPGPVPLHTNGSQRGILGFGEHLDGQRAGERGFAAKGRASQGLSGINGFQRTTPAERRTPDTGTKSQIPGLLETVRARLRYDSELAPD